jgi:hypothetical protein
LNKAMGIDGATRRGIEGSLRTWASCGDSQWAFGAVKRVTRPMLGFNAFDAAQATLAWIELMHRLKKRQLVIETDDESLTPAEQFSSLAAYY